MFKDLLVSIPLVCSLSVIGGCGSAPRQATPEGMANTETAASNRSGASSTPPPAISGTAKSIPAVGKSALPRRPREDDWTSAESIPLGIATVQGCKAKSTGEWIRLTCPATSATGEKLIDLMEFRDGCDSDNCPDDLPFFTSVNGTKTLTAWFDKNVMMGVTVWWGSAPTEVEIRRKGSSYVATSAAQTGGSPRALEVFSQLMTCCNQVKGENACVGQLGRMSHPECLDGAGGDCKKIVQCADRKHSQP